MARWVDWLSASMLAACGAGVLWLGGVAWQEDRNLQARGVSTSGELLQLTEEGGGRATVSVRFLTPGYGPVTIKRLLGPPQREGWRVGDRVPLRYLPGDAQGAILDADRDRGFFELGAGAAVLAAALGWMAWLRKTRLRLPAPVDAGPLGPDADMFAVARRLVLMESGEEANAWLAEESPALDVDFGDAADDIVRSWGITMHNAPPVRHEARCLVYGDRRVPYEVREEPVTDALLLVQALAEAVAPDYELRFCRDSFGGTVPSFIALPPAQWRALSAEAGEPAMRECFAAIPRNFEAFERVILEQPPGWAR